MNGPAAAMSGTVVAAVLAAALMHAGWNAMLKTRGDAFLSTVAVAVSAGLLCALALPFVAQPAPASWPYIAASATIHVVYYALLMATYREGDVSHAYPLMRGCAPLLVAACGMVFMGEHLVAPQWLAICLICAGVLAMAGNVRGAAPGARRTTLLALASACSIAAYTLVDGAGVRYLTRRVAIRCGSSPSRRWALPRWPGGAGARRWLSCAAIQPCPAAAPCRSAPTGWRCGP